MRLSPRRTGIAMTEQPLAGFAAIIRFISDGKYSSRLLAKQQLAYRQRHGRPMKYTVTAGKSGD
jgi:hypothetical protein